MEQLHEAIHAGWGVKVKSRRDLLGLSQEQLAQMTGLRQATISRVEKGVRPPSDRLKVLIAGALGCTLDELFAWPPLRPPVPVVDE